MTSAIYRAALQRFEGSYVDGWETRYVGERAEEYRSWRTLKLILHTRRVPVYEPVPIPMRLSVLGPGLVATPIDRPEGHATVGFQPYAVLATPAMCKADPASVCSCDEYDLPGRCPRRT